MSSASASDRFDTLISWMFSCIPSSVLIILRAQYAPIANSVLYETMS
jgi:hypothetical protein